MPNTINGDGGDNHLIGNDFDAPAGDDDIFGLGGNDFIEGLGGNDRLYGGSDNDDLVGGNGHDELYGGEGDDRLNGGGGNVTTYEHQNQHHAHPTEILDGGAGNDTMVMHYAGYTLEGHLNDPIAFTLNISTGAGQVDVFLKPGAGVVPIPAENFTSIERLDFDGPDGADRVTGGALGDTIFGNGGDDVLKGGGGDDLMGDTSGIVDADGGSGSDSFVLVRDDHHAVVIDAGAGTISVGGVSAGTFTRFENLNAAIGNVANNAITGFAGGLNVLSTAGGNDTLVGGNLRDQLSGSGGSDTLTGLGGDDTIDDGAGNDTVSGGAGNDTIGRSTDTGGRDQMSGDGGDDHIVVDVTNFLNGSIYDGGSGSDTFAAGTDFKSSVDFSHVTIQGFETLDDGSGGFGTAFTATFTAAQFDQFTTILFLHEDVVLADSATVVLPAAIKLDTLQMANGGQTVDCTAVTSTQAPFIMGGSGKDTIIGSNTVTIAAALGGGKDTFTGHAGASFMSGEDGDDVLGGGGGVDNLYGGNDSDALNGGDGNDVLTGGAGADSLTGGTGLDKFVYTAVAGIDGREFDTVAHFDAQAQDRFDLTFAVTGVDTTVGAGTLSNASFDGDLGAAITGAQLAANHAVLFTPDAGDYAGKAFLIVDANNTAGYQANADLVIMLKSASHLTALDTADFI